MGNTKTKQRKQQKTPKQTNKVYMHKLLGHMTNLCELTVLPLHVLILGLLSLGLLKWQAVLLA